MHKKLTLFIVILFLLPSSTAGGKEGYFSLDEYQELSQSQFPQMREKTGDYILGVGRGIFWAAVMLSSQKKAPLFCPPKSFGVNQDVIQSLLDQEIRERSSRDNPYAKDTPIEIILTRAFVNRFPCAK
jgi:hypothetical protein